MAWQRWCICVLFCLLGLLALAGCRLLPGDQPVAPANSPTAVGNLRSTPTNSGTAPGNQSVSPAESKSPSPTATVTPSPTATATTTPTETVTPSLTPSPTITPTYAVLRGFINQERVMCFYGPSKAYLYKYGLVGGSRLEIIGRIEDTGYIQVRAIGGDNPCWMNLQWMDVQGDINTVQPIDPLTINLPWSPYYAGPTWVKAERSGNEVNITWSPLVLRAGDDPGQELYLAETWVCQGGRLIFVPIGAYTPQVKVIDEPGCTQPSFGRVYLVEKHGYTKYLPISWPPAK